CWRGRFGPACSGCSSRCSRSSSGRARHLPRALCPRHRACPPELPPRRSGKGDAMAELALHIDGAEEASFRVLRFELEERISAPFSLSIVAGSLLPDLDLEGLLLRPASFSLDAGWAHVLGGGCRIYTGVCASAEQLSVEPRGLSLYALRL